MPVQIAMVGVWHVHTDDYYKQLTQSGKAVVRAVWDEDEEAGRAWAHARAIPFEASLDALLSREDIDAIVCDAPTTRHPGLLARAAEAGKHIFTEKLLATTSIEAERIAAAVAAAGVIATVSMPLLTTPAIRFARQCIAQGTLGRVTGARMRRSHSGVSDGWLPERWFDTSRSGGGALMDLGAHPVYVLSYLLGKPRRVSGLLTNLYGTSSDENAIALVEFEGGVLATCETAFVTFGVRDLLELYGTEGALFVNGEDARLVTRGPDGPVTTAFPGGQGLPEKQPLPLIQFLDACLAGGPAPADLTPEAALDMTRIIEAAYASDKRGVTTRM